MESLVDDIDSDEEDVEDYAEEISAQVRYFHFPGLFQGGHVAWLVFCWALTQRCTLKAQGTMPQVLSWVLERERLP